MRQTRGEKTNSKKKNQRKSTRKAQPLKHTHIFTYRKNMKTKVKTIILKEKIYKIKRNVQNLLPLKYNLYNFYFSLYFIISIIKLLKAVTYRYCISHIYLLLIYFIMRNCLHLYYIHIPKYVSTH